MKIKLVESVQPISKLEYNIKKNILPAFMDYEFTFGEMPSKINMYDYIYSGSNFVYRCNAKLELNTTNREIDIFNAMDDKPFIGDLFATLYLNSKEVELGVISSKDASSVKYALEDIDFDSIIRKVDFNKDDEVEEKLIPAHDGSMKHTLREWIDLSKELKSDKGKYKRWYNDKLPLENVLIDAIDKNLSYDERKKLEKEIDDLYFFN